MDSARWCFQEALNGALARYLHGASLHGVARALYPLAGRWPRVGLGRVFAWGRKLGIDPGPGAPEERLARAYRALDELPRPRGEPRTVRPGVWDDERHGAVPALRRVRAGLAAQLRDTGTRLFLHGSYAALDHTGYSDLDTLAVLPRAAVTDPVALRRCRAAFIASLRPLLAFDPLQHHGHFVLTEIDLAGYPAPLFPPVVLERCVALFDGAAPLAVHAVRCDWMARRRFRDAAEEFLDTPVRRAERNAHVFKAALSSFLLLPALWWQACGRPLGKKESFPALYRELPRDAAAVFRRASDVRDVWRYRERPLPRLARRVWFNPLLPAALAEAWSGPPPAAARALARGGLLDQARTVAVRMMRMEEEHARQSVA